MKYYFITYLLILISTASHQGLLGIMSAHRYNTELPKVEEPVFIRFINKTDIPSQNFNIIEKGQGVTAKRKGLSTDDFYKGYPLDIESTIYLTAKVVGHNDLLLKWTAPLSDQKKEVQLIIEQTENGYTLKTQGSSLDSQNPK